MNLFSYDKPRYTLNQPVRLFESFSGIGTQAMALKRLGVEIEHVGVSEWQIDSIISYANVHHCDKLVETNYSREYLLKELAKHTFSKDGQKPVKKTYFDRWNVKDLNMFYQCFVVSKNYGSILDINGADLGEIDIFTWSFPCTDLSKAGKQKGLDGTRSGLGYQVIRIIGEMEVKPKVLLMENVPDLLSEKFKEGWREMYHEIEKMGYTNYVEVLNAKNYGVAQNRDRVFMVSILGDYSYTFPRWVKLEKRLKDYLEDEVDEKYYLSEKQLKWAFGNALNDKLKDVYDRRKAIINKDPAYTVATKTDRRVGDANFICDDIDNEITVGEFIEKQMPRVIANVNPSGNGMNGNVWAGDISPTLTTNKGEGIKIAIPKATKQGYALAKDGDGVYINRPHQKRGVVQDGMIQTIKTSGDDLGVVVNKYSEYSAQKILGNLVDKEDVVGTITANAMQSFNHDNCHIFKENDLRIRKLTPLECWRLMGISDEDFYKAQKVCSNSQLYKQAGNAICVPVLENIFKEII